MVEFGKVKVYDPSKYYGFLIVTKGPGGDVTREIVYFHWEARCAVVWDAADTDEPRLGRLGNLKTSMVIPRAGDYVAFLRAAAPNREADNCRQWTTVKRWQEAQHQMNTLPHRLRLVRLQEGQVAEVLWQGSHPDGMTLLRRLSLLVPRTEPYGSDPIGRNYLGKRINDLRAISDGLVIQGRGKAAKHWHVIADRRATVDRIPLGHWSLTDEPLRL